MELEEIQRLFEEQGLEGALAAAKAEEEELIRQAQKRKKAHDGIEPNAVQQKRQRARELRARHGRETVRREELKRKRDNEKKYSKKELRFPFHNEPDNRLYFLFPRDVIEQGWWARLSPRGASVLLVVAGEIRNNKNQIAFCTRERIAMRSGIKSLATIDQAVKDLEKWKGGLVEAEKRRGRPNKYHFNLPTKKEYDFWDHFAFHKYIVDSGYFQRLSPRAQKVLVVMKGLSRFDMKACIELGDLEPVDEADWNEIYETLNEKGLYTLCYNHKNHLAWLAGVTYPTLQMALRQLEDNLFIQPVKTSKGQGWKVFPITKYQDMISRDDLKREVLQKHRKWLKMYGFADFIRNNSQKG